MPRLRLVVFDADVETADLATILRHLVSDAHALPTQGSPPDALPLPRGLPALTVGARPRRTGVRRAGCSPGGTTSPTFEFLRIKKLLIFHFL